MDETKQYVPTYIYPAEENTTGIKPEPIVREAAKKETDYKNTKDIPIESAEGLYKKSK